MTSSTRRERCFCQRSLKGSGAWPCLAWYPNFRRRPARSRGMGALSACTTQKSMVGYSASHPKRYKNWLSKESSNGSTTLCDTIGVANPRQVFDTFTRVRNAHPNLNIGAHFHDTRGLALANVVAALDAGIRTFDASIGGLGGCPFAPGAAGNVATEDLLYMLDGMEIETGVDLDRLIAAGSFICEKLARPTQSRVAQARLSSR